MGCISLEKELESLQQKEDNCTITEDERKRLKYLIWKYINPIMQDKEQWVINYLKNKQFLKYVDILEEEFVDDYIKRFKPTKIGDMTIGAPKCKDLSKLLSAMYRKGLLDRFAHGVKGRSQDGKFPKWVYSYTLK